MPIVADAAVAIRGDLSHFSSDLKGADKQVQTLGQRIKGALSPKNLGIAGAFTAGFAAFKAIDFIGDSIQAASDLNEEIDKSSIVFGRSAPEVQAFADAAFNIGLSKKEALGAAGAFGNMLNTVGLSRDESAEMSTTMVQLASDMASFNNEDPSDMLDKLRSGLAGEAEPLRRFGVLLSEAAVKEFAVRTGIAKSGEVLTEAQKVQARYGLMLEMTTDQQGNFALTSESLANKQRELQAKFENVSASLGTKLLPIMTALVGFISDVVVPGIQFLIDNPLVALIAITPLIVAAIGAVIGALGALLSPIGLVVLAVGALFLAWQTNFLGIRDIVGNVVGWLGDHVVPVLKGIFDAIVAVVSTAVGIVVGVIEAIVGVVSGVVDGVQSAMDLFMGIFNAVAGAIGGVIGLITAPISAIVGIVGGVVDVIAGLFDFITGGTDKAKRQLLDVKNLGTTPGGQFNPGNPGGTPGTPKAPPRPPSKPIPRFALGAWEVPRTMLGQLHGGEMVVPNGPADWVRSLMTGGGGNNYTVQLLDRFEARSVRDIGDGLRILGERGYLTPQRKRRGG